MALRREVIWAAVAGVVNVGPSKPSPADMPLPLARSSADCGAKPSDVRATEGSTGPLIRMCSMRVLRGWRREVRLTIIESDELPIIHEFALYER